MRSTVYAQQAAEILTRDSAECPICAKPHKVFPAQAMPEGDDDAVMDACTGLLWAGDIAALLESNANAKNGS